VKTVVLLSDPAGGQTLNSIMIKFCSWFSNVFYVAVVELIHMLSVRGQ